MDCMSKYSAGETGTKHTGGKTPAQMLARGTSEDLVVFAHMLVEWDPRRRRRRRGEDGIVGKGVRELRK